MRSDIYKGAGLTLTVMLLAACGASVPQAGLEPTGLTWPAAPDAPKIEFMGEFSRSADLGVRPSVWARLLGMLAGTPREGLERPMAVVASDDGQLIYVADSGVHCVHRYDLQRDRYDCLRAGRDEALDSPVGLALATDGRLFVSDSQQGRLYQLRPGAKTLEPYADQVTLAQPTGLAWSSKEDHLYVTDTGTHSVKVVDGDGELIFEFGSRGIGPGELNFPTYLGLAPNGDIVVTDSLNFRVQRFAPGGEFLNTFGQQGNSAGNMSRPKGVAVDSRGHIYITDGMFQALQVFSPTGEFLLAVGRRGQAPGEFWLPAGVFMAGDDTFYVADSYNKRVQVFRYVGGDL